MAAAAAAADDDAGLGAAIAAAEEYSNWKKNCPLLYDLVLSHTLEWPSLTVQWTPTPTSSPSFHRLLLGTHTSDADNEHLLLAGATLPLPPHRRLRGTNKSVAGEMLMPSFDASAVALHDGEVNRARYMPQQPATVATKTRGSDVLLFKQIVEVGSGERGADVVLKGHHAEGYGIEWSKYKEGWLLSGSYDSRVCLWDVGTAGGQCLDAFKAFEAHEKEVEDVAWVPSDENLFGSVGDDGKFKLWDLRDISTPKSVVVAHMQAVNSLSFNPFNGWFMVTASADKDVNLFDLRKMNTCLHTFQSHTDEVLQVEWNPNLENIIGSSSADKRVMIWDLCRIGEEQTEEDEDDGPPELLFSHGGHTAKISEFAWNPVEPWLVASVAEDNSIQIWQLAESIYSDDNDAHDDGATAYAASYVGRDSKGAKDL